MPFTQKEFIQTLQKLGISTNDAARLLSVTPRTINRWTEKPHEISGPAEQALRAWRRLQQNNLPWRPDASPFPEEDPELPKQIALLRNHAIGLDQIIQKVNARGGLLLPWKVELGKGVAKLETIEVWFNSLYNGGFCLGGYRRLDQNPDFERDQFLIEEAIYAIHKELSIKT